MNRVVSYVVAGNNMGIGRNRRKERVSLIIDAGYWTNGIGWIIFDSLHLRLPLNVHSSVLLSTFAHSPQCLPPSSATPSPGQSTGVRTFKAPQNTNDQLTYFSSLNPPDHSRSYAGPATVCTNKLTTEEQWGRC